MTDTKNLASELVESGLPSEFVSELLGDAPDVWLQQPPALLARDVRFCYPPPEPGEARATVHALPGGLSWTVWVVTRDRRGLLAASAGVLADNNVTIRAAVAASWPGVEIALQRFQVAAASSRAATIDWQRVLEDLRAAADGRLVIPVMAPTSGSLAEPVRLAWDPFEDGRGLLTVFAPDRPGLLWAIASCLDRADCDVELASITSSGRVAQDLLVVSGVPDLAALGAALAGPDGHVRISPPRPTATGAAAGALNRVLARSLSAGSERTQGTAHRVALRRSVERAERGEGRL